MLRTWEELTFSLVCVAMLSRFVTNGTFEATILGEFLDSAGPDVSVVSPHGGPLVLTDAFASYMGSGYRTKFMEYPTFKLGLLKRYLQRTAASVFGRLDPFSKTELVVNRLRGAGTRNWMAYRPVLRRATITNDLSMTGPIDVKANSIGVQPLVVSYLKQTGQKDDEDYFVVRYATSGCLICVSFTK